MKKFTTRQYILLITALIVFIVLVIQFISFKVDDTSITKRNRYGKSIDSVEILVSKISSFQNFDFSMSRDYFNFKEKKKKVIVETKRAIVKKRNYTWVKTIKLYDSKKIKFVLFINGQARFNINGKKKMIKVGDNVVVGKIVSRQKDIDSGKYTGKTEILSEYKGRALAIQKRAVYVDTFYPKKVLVFKPGSSSKLFNRNLIPKTSSKMPKIESDNDEFNLRERTP